MPGRLDSWTEARSCPTSPTPTHVWTFADLQDLPDDLALRRLEIVDGNLVVSPSTNLDHEFTIDAIRRLLLAQLPAPLSVAGPLAIDLAPSYREPDLIVVPRSLLGQRRNLFLPTEVRLAVEVVSPSSRTTDRVTKPAEYAAAGIRNYWRVETEPETCLVAYGLPPSSDTYRVVGEWHVGEMAELSEPAPLSILIERLVARP